MTSGSIFVTGGSGFAGRHIAKVLAEHGYQVVSAVEGAAAVVHASVTEDLSNEPQATFDLVRSSAQAGVQKFIHLSSFAVYGNPASGVITEDTLPLPAADAYTRTKLDIEAGLRAQPLVPELVILRLGCVYGPGGAWWSEGMLSRMERGNVIVLNEGAGIANLIHVTDIAGLILELLQRSHPGVDVFNVTDGMPVTWREYYSELERVLGQSATVQMTIPEAQNHAKQWLKPSLLTRFRSKISRKRPTFPLDDRAIETFSSQAVYSNQKAAAELGFRPRYDIRNGMSTLRSQCG